ncbi:MAG: hypothetical protein H7257_09550 [Taibaiella sp.]|nr:hypothetical protein [Taibaiella sp.]
MPKLGFTFEPEVLVTDRPELDKVFIGHLVDWAGMGYSLEGRRIALLNLYKANSRR